jgi:trehalose 6-phosphate synthase
MTDAAKNSPTPRRLVVASNRLPVVLTKDFEGDWRMERGSGGLVTALEPVLREHGGMWIGWPGIEKGTIPDLKSVLHEVTEGVGYQVRGVDLTAEERDDFYLGFSNQVIWPLFHDLLSQCNFDPRFWHTYERVNEKFADVIAEESKPGDFIWVHDYHLMAVARDLRDRDLDPTLGFFLHIPFPPRDLFVTLPWRFEIMESLLAFDLLGFQSVRDRRNFLSCVEHLVPHAEIEGDPGARVVRIRGRSRTVRAGVFPVSIDFAEFAGTAATDPVSERVATLRSEYPGRTVLLGVDRLDYSKGIPHKLQGYRLALERYPDLRGRITLVQLVVPSREDIPEYYELKEEIERLVGRIQGEFTRGGWVPIHYQYGFWDRTELIAHYRAAGIALVTPLKDGMNLVAKEFCASSLEGKGVLILSEYAGATAQMQKEALLVNPHDVEGVANAIHRAFVMPEDERKQRMDKLRQKIRETDVEWWVDTFLKAADDEDLGDARTVDAYRPVAPAG